MWRSAGGDGRNRVATWRLPPQGGTCYHPFALSGQAGAYFALFSEIGILLLVTTLAGTLGGYWLDGQLGTLPIFAVVGFLGGAGAGAVGIYRLISRFLAKYG